MGCLFLTSSFLTQNKMVCSISNIISSYQLVMTPLCNFSFMTSFYHNHICFILTLLFNSIVSRFSLVSIIGVLLKPPLSIFLLLSHSYSPPLNISSIFSVGHLLMITLHPIQMAATSTVSNNMHLSWLCITPGEHNAQILMMSKVFP